MTDLRDRDDVIDRWLRRAASAPAGPGPNAACLDAEVMAAWSEGGLSATALQAVRAHVADCARCQVLAAVMTKLDTELAGPQPGPAYDRPRARWLGWLAPLAAAAGAVAIWVFIPRQPPNFQEGAAPPPAPAAQIAQAPAAPGALPTPPPAPAQEAALSSQPAPKLKAERQSAPVDAKRQANEKDQNKPANALREEQRDRAQAAADPKKTDVRPLPPPPPAPATAPPPPVAGAVATAATAPQPAKPPPQATAQRVADGAAGRGGGGGTRAEFAQSRLAKEIVSTDESTRWRITGGVVDKTTDGGRTWTRVATGVKAEFTAGASPSPAICWIVGRAGTVLLTTDGQKWEQLNFPDATDLSAVRATDARTATVTTIEGREYATIDGGNTWIRRGPQEN